MKAKGKKLVSLFLVVSLMSISCTTMTTQRQKRFGSSKERRGATVIIQRKIDQVKKTRWKGKPFETSYIQGIKGELIAVKQNSLLLLDTEGKDVSIDIEDIKVIRVVKKSKLLTGVWVGAAICIVGGGLIGALHDYGGDSPPALSTGLEFGLMMGACFSPFAALLGGTMGGVAGIDKTIQIEGMTDLEIQKTMEKLRKKARIRDYK